MADIDMRTFARNAGTSVVFPAGSIVFSQGDPAGNMFVIQSGAVEIVSGDTVVDVCGPNEAIGFMSMIDDGPRTTTARVRDAAEVSIIDKRRFNFMVDEVPNFAKYVMNSMARRIRGMSQAI